MLSSDENLKDNSKNSIKDKVSLSVLYKNKQSIFEAYPKLNKLITALYIVTDIIDKTEPIRLKLRILGTDILSDTSTISDTNIKDKVRDVLSLLDVASTVHIISEMNANILKKEFTELYKSLGEDKQKIENVHHTWLEEFLAEPPMLPTYTKPDEYLFKTQGSNKNTTNDLPGNSNTESGSLVLKKERREDILQAIQDNKGSATITEVRLKASSRLALCGEKTLQRELISMVKDGILYKSGEKRWSRYFIKNNDSENRNESTG